MRDLIEQDEINIELDLRDLNKEYERRRPKLSDVQWLNVFPEMKSRWGKSILTIMKIQKVRLEIDLDFVKYMTSFRLKRHLRGENRAEKWIAELIIEKGRDQIAKIEKDIRGVDSSIAFYRTIGSTAKIKKIIITEEMIARAKEYPIGELLEINRSGFTRCFKHNEKTPSMYTKKNFAHCFSCGYSADTIRLLRDRDGMKFKEAVLRLQ